MTRFSRRTVLSMCFAASVSAPLMAGELRESEIYKDFEGKALKGYDVVAYHLDRKATPGLAEFAYEWKGATWWFANVDHREMFIADPERWAPQYGGYCAWAIVRDRTAPINPKIFRIFDDKLYLNLNMKVHKDWLANHEQMIAAANEKWPSVLLLAK